ncbi:MAG: hypothetical protein HYS39_00360, partial [Proteobacteria bacterium]|nr:hypothetical protein [Pseudomonadota bacterium]
TTYAAVFSIDGKRHSTISQEDWEAETLYLSSIPGMVEKIVKGMNTPIEETVKADDLEW